MVQNLVFNKSVDYFVYKECYMQIAIDTICFLLFSVFETIKINILIYLSSDDFSFLIII